MMLSFRWFLVVLNVSFGVLIWLANSQNPLKYTRVVGSCQSNWLNIYDPAKSAPICCNSASAPQPCYIGMNLTTQLTTLYGAWLLPVCAILVKFLLLDSSYLQILLNRTFFYVLLMLYRTVFLYGGFGFIERKIFHTESATDCWYAHLRRNQRCIDPFDHADHVVLFLTHFIFIAFFEFYTNFYELTTRNNVLIMHNIWLFSLMAVAAYAIFHTALSFHTANENIVAFLITQFFVMIPAGLWLPHYFPSLINVPKHKH